MENTPCKHCGRYYGHKDDCITWANTGIAERLMFLEIDRRYDHLLYRQEKEISLLKAKLKEVTDSLEYALPHTVDVGTYEDDKELIESARELIRENND